MSNVASVLPSGGLKEVAVRAISTLKGDSDSTVLDINELLAYKVGVVSNSQCGVYILGMCDAITCSTQQLCVMLSSSGWCLHTECV